MLFFKLHIKYSSELVRACVAAKFAKARWRRLGQETLIDNTEQVSRGKCMRAAAKFWFYVETSGVRMLGQ